MLPSALLLNSNQQLHSFDATLIFSLSLLNFSIRLQLVFSGEDRVLTHAVTHEQKNRGGNNGEKRIYG